MTARRRKATDYKKQKDGKGKRKKENKAQKGETEIGKVRVREELTRRYRRMKESEVRRKRNGGDRRKILWKRIRREE